MSSLVTTIPHVFPFEERVQMFREFVKEDKLARKMTGEVVGPGPVSIEIAVRRDHIVEDGVAQLNSLGSKLKSCVNVSFVNECGLPEAGLDYGGLFKEFLTDLAKAAFDPRYGLFMQTSTENVLSNACESSVQSWDLRSMNKINSIGHSHVRDLDYNPNKQCIVDSELYGQASRPQPDVYNSIDLGYNSYSGHNTMYASPRANIGFADHSAGGYESNYNNSYRY